MGFQCLSFVGILSQSASNGIPQLIFRWNFVPFCFQWDSNTYLSLESCPNQLPMGFHTYLSLESCPNLLPNGIPHLLWNLVPICSKWDSTTIFRWNLVFEISFN